MDVNDMNSKPDTGFFILYQVAAALFGFLACGFVIGLEPLFAVLSAACVSTLWIGKKSKSFLVGALLGGTAGILWRLFTKGRVLEITFNEDFLADEVSLKFDLGAYGVVMLLTVILVALLGCAAVKKRVSRSITAIWVTGVLALSLGVMAVIFLKQKYPELTVALLREKIELFIRIFSEYLKSMGDYLKQNGAEDFAGLNINAENAYEISHGFVTGALESTLLLCGILGYGYTFMLKRGLKQYGTLGFLYTDEWLFCPSYVSAIFYLILTAVCFVMELSGAQEYLTVGIGTVATLLQGAFFLFGISCIRIIRKRKSEKAGKAPSVWGTVILTVLIVIFFNIAYTLIAVLGLINVITGEKVRRFIEGRKNQDDHSSKGE